MDKLLDENVERPIGEVLKPYEKTIRNTIIYGGLGVVSIPIASTIFAYNRNKFIINSKAYKANLKAYSENYANRYVKKKSLFQHFTLGVAISMSLSVGFYALKSIDENFETKSKSIKVSKLRNIPDDKFNIISSLALTSLTNYYIFKNLNSNNYTRNTTSLKVNSNLNSDNLSCTVYGLEGKLNINSFSFKNSPKPVIYFINGEKINSEIFTNPIEKVCQQILDRDKFKLNI